MTKEDYEGRRATGSARESRMAGSTHSNNAECILVFGYWKSLTSEAEFRSFGITGCRRGCAALRWTQRVRQSLGEKWR